MGGLRVVPRSGLIAPGQCTILLLLLEIHNAITLDRERGLTPNDPKSAKVSFMVGYNGWGIPEHGSRDSLHSEQGGARWRRYGKKFGRACKRILPMYKTWRKSHSSCSACCSRPF